MILALAIPDRLAPVLFTALGTHPDLALRDGVHLEELRIQLAEHTRVRVHSDHLPWQHTKSWIDDLVADEVRGLSRRGDGPRRVWRARHVQTIADTASLLGARPLVWATDVRQAAVTTGADPVGATARAASAWASAISAARQLPDAVWFGPNSSADEVLGALNLAHNAVTVQALQMLRHLPPPQLPPRLLGALRASPAAAEALREAGAPACDLPDHPIVLSIRAAQTDNPEEAVRLATRCLALKSSPAVRATAIDALIRHDQRDAARAMLTAWMHAEDAPQAWDRLISGAVGDPEASWLRAAKQHSNPRVRGSVARWLVRNGLDRQTAETLCRVRGESWFHHRPTDGPRSV